MTERCFAFFSTFRYECSGLVMKKRGERMRRGEEGREGERGAGSSSGTVREPRRGAQEQIERDSDRRIGLGRDQLAPARCICIGKQTAAGSLWLARKMNKIMKKKGKFRVEMQKRAAEERAGEEDRDGRALSVCPPLTNEHPPPMHTTFNASPQLRKSPWRNVHRLAPTGRISQTPFVSAITIGKRVVTLRLRRECCWIYSCVAETTRGNNPTKYKHERVKGTTAAAMKMAGRPTLVEYKAAGGLGSESRGQSEPVGRARRQPQPQTERLRAASAPEHRPH
ncbi:hypothetical protein ALC56_13920 [Trachymyrmex septentrionalis]|uniref:Uncharacterized protein n=1 Tax=Trachymyrmex septentrionalis TaxID=34720 RepID=A0A195EUE8_9HYME|nr:hypothetical protein ALC56_13920 [Trachymyrmex septentrionalis]